MSLDSNKTYLVWNGTEFPNSTSAKFKAPAGSTIDWGDGTVETFDTASTSVNAHTYTDEKTEHTIVISRLTSISDSAFKNCSSLTSVTIGNSVKSIGSSAFENCSSLTSITIGNSVKSIGSGAFYNCSSLTSVMIGNSVKSIGSYAFAYCRSLTQLILFPSTPPTLSSGAIPSTIQSIYVQQSSKAAYQAATNWKTFASKIVSDNIYLSFVRFNQKNKEYIDKKINDNWNEFNLENGTGTGSLVQKRLKSDEVTWTTAKAYQGASTALGGGTQAGRTEAEFNAFFWDSTKNVPLNGGAGKNSSGEILDNHRLTYKKSYSFGVAEGEQTKALGRGSHSEGYYTETEGEYSHAEGWRTFSRGLGSHAEGDQTTASGDFSHSEGFGTSAKGAASHSEGMSTQAIGEESHAEGFATRALEAYQHVEGVYNADNPNALHIVGNGTSENARKNAFEVLKDGRAKVQSAPIESDDVVRKADLASLGGGGKLYKHQLRIAYGTNNFIYATLISSSMTEITSPDILNSIKYVTISGYDTGSNCGSGIYNIGKYNGQNNTYIINYSVTTSDKETLTSKAAFITGTTTDTVTEL